MVIGLQIGKLHGGGGGGGVGIRFPAVLDSKKPGLFRVKTGSDKILAKLINQGGAAALFSSRRPKNFENEKICLCLKIAKIISKNRRAISLTFCIRNDFIAIMTHANFHFNLLMPTMIFGIRASEPPPPPPLRASERLKRPGLIGLMDQSLQVLLKSYMYMKSYFGASYYLQNCWTRRAYEI